MGIYICQVLHERGFLNKNKTGIGFGVGREPLVSFFANQNINVLATELDLEGAKELGWADSNQHCNSLELLNERNICSEELFKEKVRFLNVDMNKIPPNLGKFDFCWSSCAFEHLGSIQKGINFVLESSKLLKPGGIGVHTTEYNLSSNEETLDNNPSFVIFRKRDMEKLSNSLKQLGFEVEPFNFTIGEDKIERYVDHPPYLQEPHLRLQLAKKYSATSIGIVIRAK